MGVTCQILINKVKDVYKPGQAVSGRVKFCVVEPTEYEDVVLSFLGRGKCTWTRRSNKHTRTYHGTEEYITTLVNICNKPDGKTITLQGEHEYSFEFFLPKNIPRSYKDRYSSIRYHIELKFVKPIFFSINSVFSAEIPVYSYLKTPAEGPVIFGLRKTLFAPLASQPRVVNLKAEVEKVCATPGENVNLTYSVTNDTDVEITSVKTELYCITTYTSNCEHTKSVMDQVDSCEVETSCIPENKTMEFTCSLPTRPELYSVNDSQIISKDYYVRATVRLPFPHINASEDFPILIGEQIGSIDPCAEVEEQDEPPPSYSEAMNK